MKKLFCIAALICGGLINAQQLDEIVNKHIEAIGGRDNWNKLNSLRMECNLKVQGSDLKITISQIDKVAVRQDIDAMGMKGYSILTTTEGWNFMPFQGMTKPEPITADELKMGQDELNIKDEFLTYKELGKKIEYLGKDDMDGVECHKVKMTTKEGQETTYFVDGDSYHVLKQIDKMTTNGKEMENTTSFSNYEKSKEGIVYPMMITSGWGNTEVKKLEINPTIDPAIFKVQQ